MIRRAQTTLIRYAQVSEFRKEICLLSKGKALNANSKLICLNVFLDVDQLLRIRGRAEILCPQQQIILPCGHYVTRIIFNWYHRQVHHTMHEACINRIRGIYYIPRLRVLYKSARRACQRCKYNAAANGPTSHF